MNIPGHFMAIFNVFPVPFNGTDIAQVRLSCTYAHQSTFVRKFQTTIVNK